jgi:hypothetical protein
MCFVWISEQTAIISLYSINRLVFITETECVYCAVYTGSLYLKHTRFVFKGLINIRTFTTMGIAYLADRHVSRMTNTSVSTDNC